MTTGWMTEALIGDSGPEYVVSMPDWLAVHDPFNPEETHPVTDTPQTQDTPELPPPTPPVVEPSPAPEAPVPDAAPVEAPVPETSPVDPDALPDLADTVVGQVHSTGDNRRFVVVQTTEGEKAWEPVPAEPEVEQPPAPEAEAPTA